MPEYRQTAPTRVDRRRTAHRPAGPPTRDTSTCRCATGPFPIVTYRDGEIVAVQIVHHLKRDRCHVPPHDVDPAEWSRT